MEENVDGNAPRSKRERDDDIDDPTQQPAKQQADTAQEVEVAPCPFTHNIWQRIAKFVAPADRLTFLLICHMTCHVALSFVFPLPWENGGKGLLAACKNGCEDYYIKWSTSAGERWRPTIAYYRTALSLACLGGSLGIVRSLLTNMRSHKCCLPMAALLHACRQGHTEIVRTLLYDEHMWPEWACTLYEFVERRNVVEPFAVACEKGFLGIVKLFLQHPGLSLSTFFSGYRKALEVRSTTTIRLFEDDERSMLVAPTDQVHVPPVDLQVPGDALYLEAVEYYEDAGSEIIHWLLDEKRGDPSVNDNRTFFIAVIRECRDCVVELVTDERVRRELTFESLLNFRRKENHGELLVSYLIPKKAALEVALELAREGDCAEFMDLMQEFESDYYGQPTHNPF